MVNRVQTHVLEKVIGTLMVVFGIVAIWIFFSSIGSKELLGGQEAVIEILLIIILAILAQTVILIRIYEQNLELVERSQKKK